MGKILSYPGAGGESARLPALGVNIGNDFINDDPFPGGQFTGDLQYLDALCDFYRVAMPYHLQTNAVESAKAAAFQLYRNGKTATYGVVSGFTTSAPDYSTFKTTSCLDAAQFAADVGLKWFIINNEAVWGALQGGYAGGAITPAQVWTDMLTLCDAIHDAHPGLKVGITEAQGSILVMEAGGYGSLDFVGMNMYDTPENFEATLGYFKTLDVADLLFISEFGPDGPYPSVYSNDAAYAGDWLKRINTIRKFGVRACMYTWRDETDVGWGIRKGDNSFKPGLEQIFTIPQ